MESGNFEMITCGFLVVRGLDRASHVTSAARRRHACSGRLAACKNDGRHLGRGSGSSNTGNDNA